MIGIVACSKTKLDRAAPVLSLYTSQLFKLSARYAIEHCDEVYVASALHGLVDLEVTLAPYNFSVHEMSRVTRDAWGKLIAKQILERHPDDPHVVILAGAVYVEPIRKHLDERYVLLDVLAGKQIGERLSFLSAQLPRVA